MDTPDQITMERRALERLVGALLDKETESTRIEEIENAMALAMVALEGDERYLESDSEELRANLFGLSLQFVEKRLHEQEAVVVSATYQDSEDDPDIMYFWSTKDEILAAMIELNVNQFIKPKTDHDIN